MFDTAFRQQSVAQETRRLARVTRHAAPSTQRAKDNVTIRLSAEQDAAALGRLSAYESRPLPAGKFLVAEVGGEVVAALPVAGGDAFGDPFRPTAQLVQLLRVRLRQLAPRREHRLSGMVWSLAR